jgi:hypothetical protein
MQRSALFFVLEARFGSMILREGWFLCELENLQIRHHNRCSFHDQYISTYNGDNHNM